MPPPVRSLVTRAGVLLLGVVMLGALSSCQPGGAPTATSSPSESVAIRRLTPSPSSYPPDPTAEPSTSKPSSSPPATLPPTPSPTGSASPTPAGPNRSLTKNTLYRVDLGRRSVSCKLTLRSPKPPLSNSALAPYLRGVVKCLTKAFAIPLGDRGFTVTAPKVKTYKKTVKTPCGKFGQRGAPAYYCSTTATIYWPVTGDDANEAYTFARLGYVGLTAHEFGHHLQSSSGMLTDYGPRYYNAAKKKRYLLSRRLELQAQCFEGVFVAAAARSIKLTDQDRYQLRVWHGYTGDEDPPKSRKPDHGTSAAQIRWLERGLDSADFGDCNTWTASKKSVD